MKRLIYIVVCVAAVACCPCRKIGATASVDIERVRDSVYMHHVDTLRVVERDTLYLAPINQWHNSVSLASSYSFLENEYCTSSASVDSVGVLTHTLDTRDSATMPLRKLEVYKRVVDTVYVSKAAEAQSTQVARVKHVTWWQRTQIVGFWLLAAAIVVKYRKVIIKLFTGWRI